MFELILTFYPQSATVAKTENFPEIVSFWAKSDQKNLTTI